MPLKLDLHETDLSKGEYSVTARLPGGAVCVGVNRCPKTGMVTMLLQVSDGMTVRVGEGEQSVAMTPQCPTGRHNGVGVEFDAPRSIPIRRLGRSGAA